MLEANLRWSYRAHGLVNTISILGSVQIQNQFAAEVILGPCVPKGTLPFGEWAAPEHYPMNILVLDDRLISRLHL